MVGDRVDVEIQKVDALRHQIDLAVVQPESGEESIAPTNGIQPGADALVLAPL
jgi:ribonuclease R